MCSAHNVKILIFQCAGSTPNWCGLCKKSQNFHPFSRFPKSNQNIQVDVALLSNLEVNAYNHLKELV